MKWLHDPQFRDPGVTKHVSVTTTLLVENPRFIFSLGGRNSVASSVKATSVFLCKNLTAKNYFEISPTSYTGLVNVKGRCGDFCFAYVGFQERGISVAKTKLNFGSLQYLLSVMHMH